ncbi:MAG: tetratricopeptide repeat protein [Phycisphaerales bacterium]|nr:tetratricopeptide repeat protein [Phycisphaerales bacterium]
MGDRETSHPTAVSPSQIMRMPEVPGEHPQTIGPYRVVRCLGEGGFGVVYLADQSEPVRRRVAIKLLKLGMDSREILARFHAERQALALMDHPGLARIYDAGLTEAGRSYFVMEYVPGLPITDYADRSRLPIADRIRLFIQVCRAVQHAHHKGIIHRDLKPSNILIQTIDDAPVPKVIDFGVAKAVTASASPADLRTEAGQLIGTPEYMPPEQADNNFSDLDTRADVYALGVVLYELLTGALPFDSDTLRHAGVAGMQRIIREQEPPRPSNKVASNPRKAADASTERLSPSETGPVAAFPIYSAEELARCRSTDVRTLFRTLRGELDWIILKCLEKDRARRYDSPNELAADLERFLIDEPVAAGPPSTVYRLRKFARRNKAPLAVAGIFCLGVVAAFVVISALLVQTRAQRDRADTEAARASQVASFLRTTLAAVDPEVAQGRDTSILRQMLDTSSARIDAELAGQPVVAGTLRDTIAGAYAALGEYRLAIPHAEASVRLLDGALGPEAPETLAAVNNLAVMYRNLERNDDVEQLYRRVIDARTKALGVVHPDTVAAWSNLAVFFVAANQLDKAEAIYAANIVPVLGQISQSDPALPLYYNDLARLRSRQNKPDEALSLYTKAHDIARKHLGPTHPNTLTILNNLATFYVEIHRPADAEPLLKELVTLIRRVYGPEHAENFFAANNLSAFYQDQGRLDEAEPLMVEAARIAERAYGPEHTRTLTACSNLALLYSSTDRFDAAQPLYRRVIDGRMQILGQDHADTVIAQHNYASSLVERGEFADAAAIYAKAVPAARRVFPEGHMLLGAVLTWQGRALTGTRDFAGAEAALNEAKGLLTRLLGPDHARTRLAEEALKALEAAWAK